MTSAHHNRKRPEGTLMARIETFFRNNPDEWLTWPDMAAKFDGIERTHVITADEEGRMIVRHCTDEKGRCYLNAAGTDTAQETLFGTVRIELREKVAA